MQVQVLRVSGTPHDVEVWCQHRRNKINYYIDQALITAEGAAALAAAANANRMAEPRSAFRGAARVRVLRVSGMPHAVQAWCERGPTTVDYYVDQALITAEGAAALAAAATVNRMSAGHPRGIAG